MGKRDKRFCKLAMFVSKWSKNLNAKVGAVAFSRRGGDISIGYNGFTWIVAFSVGIWTIPTAISAAERHADFHSPISLAGRWNFRLDPKRVGIAEKWYRQALPDQIHLPGSTDQAGFGTRTAAVTTEWLNRVYQYVGSAWYEREVVVPDGWAGKRIVLFLERCHWETQVWIDGKPAGMQDSLCTPHQYELSGLLSTGRHRLTIRVDNRYKVNVGGGAHSMSDNTQTNWNGIIGRIELLATDPTWIEDMQVYPNVTSKTAEVRVTIGNATGRSLSGRVVVMAEADGTKPQFRGPKIEISKEKETKCSVEVRMGDGVRLWDEFSPNLYEATVILLVHDNNKWHIGDTKIVRFGMREFSALGTQFAINGRRTLLRGTLECCVFPQTGYPPTDVDGWLRIIRIAKAHGLNHFRFHSWCPPEAAFGAADREGFILHVEGPVWTYLGEDPELDAFIWAEGDRILRAYGNHPSFCMLCVGNEPYGDHQKEFLSKIVSHWKQIDSRRLFTGCSGWPVIPENQYQSTGARIQYAETGLTSRVNAQSLSTDNDYADIVARFKVPIVSHEMGQWCSYPNLDEIKKYTGVVQARNYEVFRDRLAEHHMLDQTHDFLMASGKLQTLLYKEDIEAALRTPGFGGFQLLDLHDFPGQHTAPVGVLDAFWDGKCYVTAAEFHRFCCETVPLLRMKKCVFTADETFTATVEVAHYGPAPIPGARPRWTITGVEGRQLAAGELPVRSAPIGGPTPLGRISLPLAKIAVPAKLTVTVSLEGTPYGNHWDLWVYPTKLDIAPPADVFVVDSLGAEARAALCAGRKVLLLLPSASVRSDVPPCFSTIFWNTACFPSEATHTLGLLCDPKHPALAEFPTEFHANWQWWDLVRHSKAMVLDDFPAECRPLVQVIDDWYTCRKLGLIFEARVGGGRLLVCSIDLHTDMEHRPVARQLLRSLLDYMRSEAFAPRQAVDAATICRVMKDRRGTRSGTSRRSISG